MYSNIHDSSSVCSYLYMKFVLDIVHLKKNPIHEGDVILLISNDNAWDIASLIFFLHFFFILRQRDKARDNTKNATSRKKKKFSHIKLLFFHVLYKGRSDETIVFILVGYFFVVVVVIVPLSSLTEVILHNKRKDIWECEGKKDFPSLLCGSLLWNTEKGTVSTKACYRGKNI